MGPLGKEDQPVRNFSPHMARPNHLGPQLPPQWLNCDLRRFDYSTLGKFHVILADPPWDIHMSVRMTIFVPASSGLANRPLVTLWHHDR